MENEHKMSLSEKHRFDLVTDIETYLARILNSQKKVPHINQSLEYKNA